MLFLRTIKSFLTIMLVIMVFVLYGFGLQSCTKNIASITVAYSPYETTGLAWIANDQNFFESNGINITLLKHETGAGALDGILNGSADIVVGTTEFPIVGQAFQESNITIISSIAKSEIIYIIGRKDRGIESALDLRGKVIGTTYGTIAEFCLGRFLELNGIGMQDIALINLKTPEEWVYAIVNGDIDAVVTAQPYANEARKLLGSNAVFWSAQSGQLIYSNLVASKEWVTDNPWLVKGFLKSLIQAEEFTIHNPSDAKASIQKQLSLDASYMETVWAQNQFGLSLEQSLILTMEDEARWMIANNLTTEKQIPNFLDYIHEAGLKELKPEAVNIIR